MPRDRKEYASQHYADNREAILAGHRERYAQDPEHKARKNERSRRWYVENRERAQAHYAKNREAILEIKRERYRQNPEVLKARSRAWREANGDLAKQMGRAGHLRRKYGLDLAAYQSMLAAQDGLCAICAQSRRLVVDHDHTTGDVRSLLCVPCNFLLGLANDSTQTLARAIDYLNGSLATGKVGVSA